MRYETEVNSPCTTTRRQARFPTLCRFQKTTAITRHGEVVAFLVPKQRMPDLPEQVEILANPGAMDAKRRAKAGKATDRPLGVLDEDCMG